jgi:hypothetical protein
MATQYVSYLDAGYELQAYAPSIGYLECVADLLAYKKLVHYLSVNYDLSAYQRALSYLDATFDLLAYQRFIKTLDVSYDLTAYQALTSTYLDASYALNAYTPVIQALDVTFDLITYQAAVKHLDVTYDLLVTLAYYGYALNLKTGALSKFDNFKFNSLSGDMGADENGIYTLTGTTDDGTPIPAFIETGTHNLGSDYLKRVSDAYIALNGGGVTLTLFTDNGTQSYVFGGTSQLKTVKRNLSLKAKGRFWKAKLANVEGSSTRIDGLDLIVDNLSRKV